MKIVVTGASGFIGAHFVAAARARGHAVTSLVRVHSMMPGETAFWEPESGVMEEAALDGSDAVVHLAGERIAAPRWSAQKKERIRQSRLKSTRLLAETIDKLGFPPRIVLSGSAIGIYGERGAEVLTEEAVPGAGFLADVVKEWEAEAQPIASTVTRLVLLRTGIVIGPDGGFLEPLLLPFRFGLGARLGDGRQYISWIALEDMLEAMFLLLESPLQGPVNMVGPAPVTQAQLTKSLGRALHRPALARIPAWVLRAAAGEVARELLLTSTRAVPAKLQAAGFVFKRKSLDEALHVALD